MYSCQSRKHILFWLVVALWLCSYVLWVDLKQEIVTKFQDDYDLWLSDEYLTVPYDPLYSKDPFWDSMKLYQWMSVQARVAGVKYVERALAFNGCSLSKEKEWSILYYFVPEFRWEIARTMKMEMGDYASKNYVFEEEEIFNYCMEFYNCLNSKSGWDDGNNKMITSGTPEEIKTNCKEFFQSNYRYWQAEEKKVQNLQASWLWNDKYLNATVDDSPYDVVSDLATIWELSYLHAQQPITPVFFDLPLFANSKNALLDRKNWWSSDEEELTFGGSVSLNPVKDVPTRDVQILNSVSRDQTYVEANSTVKPLSRVRSSSNEIKNEYDKLVEWLWAYRLNNDKSTYYWSLCIDEEEEPEVDAPEQEVLPSVRDVTVWRDISNLTKDEYQEVMDYMVDAVKSYASLSESKKEELKNKAWKVNDAGGSEEETEKLAKDILECYKACVDLSFDEQLACMLRCSCGEIASPIFNPDVNPGMWPIFMIRYCAVPAVNPRYFYEWNDGKDTWKIGKKTSNNGNSRRKCVKTRYWECVERSNEGWDWDSNSNSSTREAIWTSFNPGWITIVSMEKWVNEILWVTDKLAREWKLWMWTQQYNFLDSSTKMMKFSDIISFTIAADKKDISQKAWEPTDEYVKRVMKTKNDNWLLVNHVANPLDNPATKNYYLLVSYEWERVWDIAASANADVARDAQWYLNVAPSFIVDQSENSNASRYASVSVLFSEWFDEQGDFWAKKVEYLDELDSYARALYAKKW